MTKHLRYEARNYASSVEAVTAVRAYKYGKISNTKELLTHV
jgi:hypothetical protein